MNNKRDYWYKLKSDFIKHIKDEILAPQGECKRYTRSMDLLIAYALENGYSEYSPELGMAFFESEKDRGYKGDSTLGYRRATIRHLNEFVYGNSFWQRKPRNVFRYQSHKHKSPLACPDQFSAMLEEFLQSIYREGLKDVTIEQYRRTCIKLLQDIDSQGITDWKYIKAKNLTTAYMNSSNKHHFVSYARRFFRYLLESSVVETDYTGILPTVPKKKSIPSVYNEDEISQLLENMETITPQGKRDYAIVLVALRLGLRQSDIRLLRFENVDFMCSRIRLVQLKTSVALQLSMPDCVIQALQDYIKNGREESDSPYLFLNGYGEAMTKHAISHIVARHFKNARIDVGSRHSGSHSLRMTFASQLVAENVPYEVVRVLLGHASRESTRHYVEFSIEGLRECALEVPEPSGMLAQFLAEGV